MGGARWPGTVKCRFLLLATAALLGLVTACSGGDNATATPGADKTSPPPPAAPKAEIAITPAPESTDVPVKQPIEVKVVNGTLTTVTMTNSNGAQIDGVMAADKSSWTFTDDLAYSRGYKVVATAVNAENKTTQATAEFTTIAPSVFTLADIYPRQGDNWGVGQPVRILFDEDIPDRAAAEAALTVTTDPPVEGRWSWMSDRELQWRPQNYWTPNTKVSVEADIYGVHVGNGMYGQQDNTASFRISKDSRIAIIDNNKHSMDVIVNGQTVQTMPVSLGRDASVTVDEKVIDFNTQSGVHVVSTKERSRVMSSASFGLPEDNPEGYSETIEYALRISNSGEFIHSAPWSVQDQGVRNVSHGCVNLSPENAIWMYNNFQLGDPVEIRNTKRQLPSWDGFGGWNMSWAQWVAGSALP